MKFAKLFHRRYFWMFLALVSVAILVVFQTTNAEDKKDKNLSAFGGRIYFVLPCTCSNNQLFFVGPQMPGAYLYQPGVTRLFSAYATWIGAQVLGNYKPGAGVCMMNAGPYCFPIPSKGMIIFYGSSKG